MTILEALKANVSYPVNDNQANLILIKRGLTGTATIDQSIANSQAFELAKADLLTFLLSAANGSEGSFSFSLTEKSLIQKQAAGIYAKYGETNPMSVTLTNASSRW